MWENNAILAILRHRGLHACLKRSRALNKDKRNVQELFKVYNLMRDGDPAEQVVSVLIDVNPEVKCGKTNLLKWIQHNSSVNHVILLVSDVSHPAEKAILEIPNKRIELLRRKDIRWDKSDGPAIPNYALLTEAQVKELESRRKIKREIHLAKMSLSDPMAVFFGFLPGDVVYAIDYDTYRIVDHN